MIERAAGPVREKIVELKQANGSWGVRRIAQLLRRLVPAAGQPGDRAPDACTRPS